MVLGVDEFLVRTPFEDMVVRAVRGEARPTGDDLASAVHAARELRQGLALGDPAMISVA